jgi:hypothetical protein
MTIMTSQLFTSQLARPENAKGQFLRKSRARIARMAAWLAICADYHAAAATYEELSRLSDVELKRRGLSRESLAKDVCEAADRAAKP